MKSNYSGPYFYTGGIKIKDWSKLTKKDQEDALSKEWYVYFSFRNPETGKLERQQNIKTGVNSFKTKNERLEQLKLIQESLLVLLRKGFSPFQDNNELENKLFKKSEATAEIVPTETPPVTAQETKEPINAGELSIREAFEFGLKIKVHEVGKTSYSDLKGKARQFLKWLDENGDSNKGISTLNKKTLNNFLNDGLEKSKAKTRNNTRAYLSMLLQVLVNNEIIKENFIKDIVVLKSKPERNKTYSKKQEEEILKNLSENDPILLLFIQFISYNFLRPVEICRLKIKDLDLNGKTLTVKAKNKAVKVKIIPQKILDLLPDLSKMNPDYFLFTPTQIGGEWETEENNKRNYFSKRFKIIKDLFGLGKDYGLYSFRHTAITNLYRELRKTKTPFEAKSILIGITGHETMEALEKYLRDIDAELPEDYSTYLK